MATDIDLVNQALSHIGNRANVSSIDPPDGTVEANWAARFYRTAVYRALAREDWSFARTRAALGAEDLPAGTVWRYAYGVPSDCVQPRRVLTGDQTQYEDDTAAYEREGSMLLTNQADAVLIYTRAITDATKFTPLFGDTVALDLAAYLAGPILKGSEGVNAASKLRQAAAQVAREALALDANASARPQTQYVPGSLAARGTTQPITASTMLRS